MNQPENHSLSVSAQLAGSGRSDLVHQGRGTSCSSTFGEQGSPIRADLGGRLDKSADGMGHRLWWPLVRSYMLGFCMIFSDRQSRSGKIT